LTPFEARNADGFVLHTYEPDPAVLLDNLATGKGALADRLLTFDDDPVLPPGTVDLHFSLQLFAPDENVVVSSSERVIPVRDPEAVVTKTIPAGQSVTSFTPVPVKLNASNPTAGVFTVEEF